MPNLINCTIYITRTTSFLRTSKATLRINSIFQPGLQDFVNVLLSNFNADGFVAHHHELRKRTCLINLTECIG